MICIYIRFAFINLYLSHNLYALRKCFDAKRISCVCYRASTSYNGRLKIKTFFLWNAVKFLLWSDFSSKIMKFHFRVIITKRTTDLLQIGNNTSIFQTPPTSEMESFATIVNGFQPLTRRQSGKRTNHKTDVTRKQSTPNFPKNKHFLPPYLFCYFLFFLVALNYCRGIPIPWKVYLTALFILSSKIVGDKSLEKGLAQFFKKSLKKIYKGSKKTHTQKNRYSCEILKKKKVMKNFKDHLEIKNYLQNQKSSKNQKKSRTHVFASDSLLKKCERSDKGCV